MCLRFYIVAYWATYSVKSRCSACANCVKEKTNPSVSSLSKCLNADTNTTM